MKNPIGNPTNQDTLDKATDHELHAIGLLFEPGDVIEIRALNVGRTHDRAGKTYSGYFNFENEKAIRDAIEQVNGKADGVYVVLNRFDHALLARADNHLQVGPKNTTSDHHVIERRWIYIDVDAARAAGISASAEEHKAAIQRAVQIGEHLTSLGWPEPILADSGNGGHLLYRLRPLDLTHAGRLVKACLKALAARFSDTTAIVDESTASAARLCKLYGTQALKGDSTSDRPHRCARILGEPERVEAVSIEALESLAAAAKSTLPAVPSTSTSVLARFDVEQWLASNGLEIVKGPDSYQGGRRWTLRICPFNTEHQKPVVIQLPAGPLVYKCLHNSCAQNDWQALRLRVEPSHDLAAGLRTSWLPTSPLLESVTSITNLSQIPSVWGLEATLNWTVEEVIGQGSVTLLCAESGTGKTWLAYYIAGCVACGVPILGRKVRRSKVLYLDGENPLYVVKQRLLDLGIEEAPDLTIWGGWNVSPPPGPQSPLVFQFAREHRGLIIYDSLIEFHPGSEQSSTETRAFMRQFRALANSGATVIVLHNAGKAETAKLYRGSSDIKAAVDTAYLLRRADDGSQTLGKLSMTCFKGRLAPGQNFGMEFRHKHGFVPCDHIIPLRTIAEVVGEFLKANPGSNQSGVVKAVRGQGFSKRQIETCLKTGQWSKIKGPDNSTLYTLPSEETE